MNKCLALLLTLVLAACQGSSETPFSSFTDVPTGKTHILATPFPTTTALPFTATVAVLETAVQPTSVIPTVISMEQGITWTECIIPAFDRDHSAPNYTFAQHCLNIERPVFDDHDRSIMGERIEGSNGSDLKQVIGNDVYLVKHDSTYGCCDYQLLKNGNVLLALDAPFISFDPNRHLWNFGGRLVWELITEPPTIIVDGVDFNQKYGLESVFHPYLIQDKLIYIAKKSGKYQIMYDEKTIGPVFDEIYIKYCCSSTQVEYGGGRYQFFGKRGETYSVVVIQ